ncbi:hypothetical protein [Roseixanthobacter psychrophilus]|uniref:hypothetical protein n=1 Tax=Roseixanthobacter psychrophilus TaxID=3119917 RepID=UPI003D237C11
MREHIRHGEITYISTGRGERRQRRMFDPTDIDAFVAARRKVDQCPSISPREARSSTSTSNSEVYDFMAQRAARRAARPSATKPASGKRRAKH